ncbi:MAG TPA: sensor histidine kinase [Opitutus sp.]|nr:sensor histidine kinase [Opitutus sp.]
MAVAFRPLLVAVLSGIIWSRGALAADPAQPPLNTAAAVLSLTAADAGHRLPVAVAGIVTAAEPDWGGQFFVQDATGAVFVENLADRHPAVGDVVTVTGVSHPGAFAPIISAPHWQVTGHAPLPAPKQVSIENLEAGVEDGWRVEIDGLVRAARPFPGRLELILAIGGYRLEVRAPLLGIDPASLIGDRVRVRGTTATHYNAALRHLTSVAVYIPAAADFVILDHEAANPLDQPVIPLNDVAQYRRGSGPGQRVHVRGVVTLQRFGEDVFIQDATGGLRIETDQTERFTPGEQIEAAGFLEYENYLPFLRDATLHPSGATGTPLPPRPVPVADIRNGFHHADVITLRGRIISRSTRPVVRLGGAFSGIVTTWLIHADDFSFTAEREDRVEDPTLAAIPVGSIVDVAGVCFSDIDEGGKLKNLKLLLASSAGLRVVERPSWFTPDRLLAGVGLLSAILLLVALWTLTVSRKNAALQVAQKELREAHDTLEQKVVERSAQLQTEMTARRSAELQFKAVLSERTRLARELHDSLEQTLTGIALQLDAAARLFQRSPGDSNAHLQLARNWLRQSQVDLHRSVWDLRSRELEQFDLANALRQTAERLVDGTAIRLDFTTRGDKRPLPETVEENVLRIGQEALTNIAKHARATRVSVALAFEEHALSLRVEDNGIGFTPSPIPAPADNRFGLLGMSERARRLAGRLDIESVPSRGTVVTVEIPLARPAFA